MGRLTDYSEVNTATENNVFLLDGTSGTKIISSLNLSKSMAAMLPADNFFELLDSVGHRCLHRQIYRGKNLGSTFTAEHLAAIQNGSFAGLWLGDYWSFTSSDPDVVSTRWRIVDFDYWYRTGEDDDPNLTRHHIVVMPDFRLYHSSMNDTNTTDGGYYYSKMRGGAKDQNDSFINNGIENSNLAKALAVLRSTFGEHIMPHYDYITNAVTDGVPTGTIRVESLIDIPSEIMMYGTDIRSIRSTSVFDSTVTTYNKSQLAAMQAVPELIGNRSVCWLRDVVGPTRFAAITKAGVASSHLASDNSGVRPIAAIG